MKKLTYLLIAFVFAGFLLSNIDLGLAQTSAPVNRIITQTTTWVKTNTVLGVMAIQSANAQSLPTPSVPEFIIRLVNASYIIITNNSYNGQAETQQISNNSVEVAINNQPFSYGNNSYQVYFNLRVKPHFENASWWQELYPLTNYTNSPPDANGAHSFAWFISDGSPNQTSSEQTVVTFSLAKVAVGYNLGSGFGTQFHAFLSSIPENGQIDFQVEALVGHNSEKWAVINYNPYIPENETFGFVPAVAYDSTSGWSNTQTLSLISTPTPTENPTKTSDLTPQSLVVIGVTAIVVAVSVGLIVYYKKHR